MKLYQLQTINGHSFETEIADVQASLLSSRSGLSNFLRLYAGRVFGGREGRDWRVCQDERCLVPLTVNQIVSDGYGDQLLIK